MAFEPITTQEQFDEMVKDRLQRAAKKFEGYISPEDFAKSKADYEKQITNLNSAMEAASKKAAQFDSEIAKRDQTIKAYEVSAAKTRIAHEVGLSYDATAYLSGEDEDSIRKSAEGLKNLLGTATPQPLASTEGGTGGSGAKSEFNSWFNENFNGGTK